MINWFANPARFMRLSARALPWCGWSTVAVLAIGIYLALVVSPPDYQQGDAARIMYVHVPAAWMALSIYLFIAVASGVALVWRHPLAEIAARASAPIGAAFTFVCLTTGSLWGRPMWGAWWVWDARLTSVLVLFFLYLGYIALVNGFDDPNSRRQGRLDLSAGRRRQSPDHQILGRLVEHFAPAGERAALRQADDCAIDAGAAADHGGGFYALVRNVADATHANGVERAQGSGAAPRRWYRAESRPTPSGRARIGAPGAALKRPAVTNIGAFLAMGGYAVFVWPAYGLSLVVLGGLALHSWRRYRQSVRALEQLQRQIETR